MRSFATALLFLAPAAAVACPVCGQGREGTAAALLVMTIIMSALPLLMIGGVVAYAVRRARLAERPSAPSTAPPSRR